MSDIILRLAAWCTKKNKKLFLVMCLFAHISLEILFAYMGTYESLLVNTVSLAYYMIVVIFRKEYTSETVEASCYEIILFSMAQTFLLGFEAYFWLYSIGIASLTFLIVGGIRKESFKIQIFAVISLCLDGILKLIFDIEFSPVAPDVMEKFGKFLTIINFAVILLFIYILSFVYTLEITYANLRLEKNNELLQYSAEHDILTGLLNRSVVIKKIDEYKLGEYEEEVIVCMMDIDLFKQVNDRYGHAVGDEVLIGISSLLRDMAAEYENIRWGGEEFLMISREPYSEKLINDIENYQNEVRKLKFEKCPRQITVTIGMTKGSKKDIESLIVRADELLYQGKEEGRDRIVKDF